MDRDDNVSSLEAKSPLITKALLAALLLTTSRNIDRMNSADKIPKPIRIGSRPRWIRTEIEDWIKTGCPDRPTWERMQAGNPNAKRGAK